MWESVSYELVGIIEEKQSSDVETSNCESRGYNCWLKNSQCISWLPIEQSFHDLVGNIEEPYISLTIK